MTPENKEQNVEQRNNKAPWGAIFMGIFAGGLLMFLVVCSGTAVGLAVRANMRADMHEEALKQIVNVLRGGVAPVDSRRK